MNRKHLIFALLMTVGIGGCSGTNRNPWDSLTSRFPSKDSNDPLALDPELVSDEFRVAKKTLNAPEKTMLRFARWKEDMGQYAEAKHRYREILSENDKCLDARLGIARIERATGRFDQCRDILITANEQNPGNSFVLLELGRMFGERQEWDKAISYLGEAADQHPDEQTVRYELGLAMARANRYDEALPHLRFAVGESAAFYNIGFMLSEDGHQTEARPWIEKSLNAHPDDRTARSAHGLLARLDKPATDASLYDMASQLSGRQSDVEPVGAESSNTMIQTASHPAIQPSTQSADPTQVATRHPATPAVLNRLAAGQPGQVQAPTSVQMASMESDASPIIQTAPQPSGLPASVQPQVAANGQPVAPLAWNGPVQQAAPSQPAATSQPAESGQIISPPQWRR